jgi:hypothetical protein
VTYDSATKTVAIITGTTSGTVAAGNDTRITGAEQTSNKDQNGGYAGLNSSGKIASSAIPSLAITSVTEYSSRTALYADSANQQEGDVGVVTYDPNKGSYVRNSTTYTPGSPNGSACWVLLAAPTDVVTSVNGYTGTVSLTKSDVSLGNVDNTADTAKPVSTAQQTALDGKQAASVNLTTAAAQGTASVRAIAGDGTALTAAASDHSHTGLTVQAAGTASVRTIGTGATEAAAGNHTHTGLTVQAAGTASVRALGSGSTDAAAGDHTHTGLTVQAAGTASVRAIGTGSTDAAAGDHTHTGLTVQAAGTASVRALGTGATDAAAGNHTHNASDINAGTLAIGRIPTGTTSSTVALGNAAPNAHAATHGVAGGDAISIDATYQIATGTVSQSRLPGPDPHTSGGLLPMPRWAAQNTVGLSTASRAIGYRCMANKTSISNIYCDLIATGTSSSGDLRFAIWDSSYTMLAATGNLASTFNASGTAGLKTIALSYSSLTAGNIYYLGYAISGFSVYPTVAGATNLLRLSTISPATAIFVSYSGSGTVPNLTSPTAGLTNQSFLEAN